jgi:hypothetical protein
VRRVPREARAEHGAVLEKEVELCIYWGGWGGTSENDVPLLTKVVCWMLEDLSKKNIDFETFVAA